MSRRPPIAVLSAGPTDLPTALAALPAAPQVRLFRDLYGDGEALRELQPGVLLVEAADLAPEDRGALRLLRAWMPETGVVLVGAADAAEAELRAAADELGATPLPRPFSPAELAGAVDAAALEHRRSLARPLLDLVRGICDEVNNPLLVTAGYVQLLRTRLDPQARDELDMLDGIQAGLDRLSATMDKILVLTRADEIRTARQRVDVGALAAAVAERVAQETGRSLSVQPLSEPEAGRTRGHADLLEAMLETLCRAGVGLLDSGAAATLSFGVDDSALHVTLHLSRTVLPPWRLSRTFEPYSLKSALHGAPDGLSLFLVDVVAHAHGGRTAARWHPRGGVCLEVELPR
jgi:signal transduction histidine kinase